MFDAQNPFEAAGRGVCTAMRAPKPMPRDQRVLLSVTGMNCADSIGLVRDALMQVTGVAEVRCDIPSESAWVRFDPDRVADRTLPGVLGRQGFDARLVQLRMTARVS